MSATKVKFARTLSEEELEELDQFLWDLNTRAINGEKVEFPRFPDDIMYQLGEWRHKRLMEKAKKIDRQQSKYLLTIDDWVMGKYTNKVLICV